MADNGASQAADRDKKHERPKRRVNSGLPWKRMSYTARVTVSFALISVMTALIAFGVLSYVWEGHFQEYTHDNMERTAQGTAMAISEKYEQTHRWSTSVLAPASSAADPTPTPLRCR